MMRFPLLFQLAVLTASAQIRTGQFMNRDVWIMETPELRVTIMQSGGHIAEIVLKDGGVNPLWIQKRPTIDADRFEPARDAARYGGGSGARLMSGLLGHNVCFPFWGNPSDAEAKAGMTFHGETGITRWKQSAAPDSGSLAIGADLPQSQTRFSRTLRVKGQVLSVESVAENLSAWDRPAGWCEHVTFGPPFLEKEVTLIDASLGRGRTLDDKSGQSIAYDGTMRTVRNDDKAYGFVKNFVVDSKREYGFFTVVHPAKRLLIGYIFPRSQFRWLNVWEANNPDMLTRGMEFSNTPSHGTMKAMVAAPSLFGEPTYDWLEAKSKLAKRFAAFSMRVPPRFKGVAEVRIERNQLIVVERESSRTVEMEWPFAN